MDTSKKKHTPIFLSQLIPMEELSSLCKEYQVGIELVDFSVGMNLDLGDAFLLQWKEKVRQMGNPPLTLHGPFLDLNPTSYEPYIQRATKERYHQAYQAALALGARKIVYHTGRIPQICYIEGWSQRMADFWNAFLEEHSVLSIAVENVFDESPKPIADFASQISAPNFSLCLDVGHAHCFSQDSVHTWLETLSPWLSHLHLHDNHGKRDEHLPIGDGSVPWKEILPAMQTLPRLETITIENVSFSHYGQSLENLREFLP